MVNHRTSGKKKRHSQASKQCDDKAAAPISSDVANLWQPTHDEIMKAIESLYADSLKPVGRILAKRVTELAARGGEEDHVRVDTDHVQAICRDSVFINFVEEPGGDWAALFVDHPHSYVDIYNPEDTYPPQMWAELASYVNCLSGDESRLPGGRYSCALALQKLELPLFEGRSLGELNHIVQLAISKKKILGYLSGELVAYVDSQARKKEECAKQSQAFTHVSQCVEDTSMDVADLETARSCLRKLLDSSEERVVPLSNVKRLMRERFNVELSETKLGHSKISELLKDHRFADICTVKLQKHGYSVFQVIPQESVMHSLFDSLHDADGRNAKHEKREQRSIGRRPPICEFLEPLELADLNSGIFFEAAPSWPGAPSGCQSESDDSTVDSARVAAVGGFNFPPTPSPSCECRRCSVENGPRHMTPLRGLGVPEKYVDVDLRHHASLHDFSMARSASKSLCLSPSTSWTTTRSHPISPTALATAPSWPCPSPSGIPSNNRIGSTCASRVHNTFIHLPLPPPTPHARSSARRPRSVPKNLGSNKDAWEITCQALGAKPEPDLISYGKTPECWIDFYRNLVRSPALTTAPSFPLAAPAVQTSNTGIVISISDALPPNSLERQSRTISIANLIW